MTGATATNLATTRFRKAVGGLGVSQIIAWGCVYYPVSVTGPAVARDLGLSQGALYAAYAVLLLASAVVAPAVGRAIDRHGGRPVLCGGCVLAGAALAATAFAGGPRAYFACSLGLGVAAGMTLYDAAFPALVQAVHPQGRRAITLVTFAGGFASTIFWPITAGLVAAIGWQDTYLSYAAVMLLVCLPVNWIVLEPRVSSAHVEPVPAPLPDAADPPVVLSGAARRRALVVLAMTIAANQVVAAGFLIHIIDFAGRIGIGPHEAIFLGMLFGPAQVLGRVGEMAFGGRFEAITTGRIAAAFLPLGLLFVVPTTGNLAATVVFVLALGLSNGLMTIARGTVTLALFGHEGYGATIGKLTVPSLVARAAGPLLFALSMQRFGIRPTVLIGLIVSFLACLGMEIVARLDR